MITLRDYQVEARDSILGEWKKGVKSTFVVLSTGAGKTEIGLSVFESVWNDSNARLLWLAHRKELIYQPRDRVIAHWKEKLPIPGIVMGENDDIKEKFIIATVQSLKGERLKDCLQYGAFTHIGIDECHHAPSRMYKTLLEGASVVNPDVNIFGVTATPLRSDKVGLISVFESCAYKFPIDMAIRKGALVPFSAMGFSLPVDFSEVPETKSESGWDNEVAGKLLSLANVEEVIVETWKKHASERKTIAFTSSVSQAYSLALAFRMAGFTSVAFSGSTKDDERASILEDFKAGKIQILVNCQVLTEGFDCPDASCVIMASPMKSDLPYIQRVGRVLRLAPGKENALILDFSPKNARNIRMAGNVLGQDREVKTKEKELQEEGVILDCFGINRKGSTIEGNPDDVAIQILDYLGTSHLAWTYDGQISSVSIAPQSALVVVGPQLNRIERANQLKASGQWRPEWEDDYQRICSYQVFAVTENKQVESLGAALDWQGASYLASDYADQYSEQWLAERDKRWRNKPAGEKQENFCKRLGVWREGMRCGEASQAITHALSIKVLKNLGIIRD